MLKNRKKLAIDFDGVIAHTDSAKVKFARDELGLNIEESVMKERYFIELYGLERGKQLYHHIIKGVYNTERMFTDVLLMEKSKESIAFLQSLGWKCIIITSRHGEISDSSPNSPAAWAWRFINLHDIPIDRSNFFNVSSQSKLQACIDNQVDALVDDDYFKLLPVLSVGIRGYLFTNPTNRSDEKLHQPFLARRVYNWPHLIDDLTDFIMK